MAERSKRPRRSGDVQDHREDRLSSLPDDILIDAILPLLPMREAARTSLFSRRWRPLWPCVPCLDLDGSGQVEAYPRKNVTEAGFARFEESADQAASEYADWVDRVIGAYRGPAPLRSFRILFRLDGSFKRRIDRWLMFSFQKGVQALQLQPRCRESYYRRTLKPPYSFPVIQPSLCPNIKLLKSLILNDLVMTNDALEKLLSACDSLEILQLRSLDSLTAIKVTGPESRLISIDVRKCRDVRSVEIRSPTPDLVSFQFDGAITNVHIECAPRLVHQGIFSLSPQPLFGYFSYISQVESLHLRIQDRERANDPLTDLPDLSRVKHLRLELLYRLSDGSHFGRQLQWLDPLINELPSLQHLTLEMQELDRKLKIGEEVPNSHLELPRVIELVGFRGWELDCELALYLIKSAVSLEKLIIDFRRPALWGDISEYPCSDGTIKKWRRTATKRITPGLPPKAKLVFI